MTRYHDGDEMRGSNTHEGSSGFLQGLCDIHERLRQLDLDAQERSVRTSVETIGTYGIYCISEAAGNNLGSERISRGVPGDLFCNGDHAAEGLRLPGFTKRDRMERQCFPGSSRRSSVVSRVSKARGRTLERRHGGKDYR